MIAEIRQRRYVLIHVPLASMGPRSSDRGNPPAFTKGRPTAISFNGAAIDWSRKSRLLVTRHSSLVTAVLGPRSNDRGNPPAFTKGRPTAISFNGAAIEWSRKSLLLVTRHSSLVTAFQWGRDPTIFHCRSAH
jgi:hypothetical protein